MYDSEITIVHHMLITIDIYGDFRNRRQMHCLLHSDCKFNALDNEVVLGDYEIWT